MLNECNNCFLFDVCAFISMATIINEKFVNIHFIYGNCDEYNRGCTEISTKVSDSKSIQQCASVADFCWIQINKWQIIKNLWNKTNKGNVCLRYSNKNINKNLNFNDGTSQQKNYKVFVGFYSRLILN